MLLVGTVSNNNVTRRILSVETPESLSGTWHAVNLGQHVQKITAQVECSPSQNRLLCNDHSIQYAQAGTRYPTP